MRLLLDTHVIIWAASRPERLGRWHDAVVQADRRWMSAASTWELALKAGLGKLDLGMDVGAWTTRAVEQLQLTPLDIRAGHAAAVQHLPPVHRDPFDRLLIATARLEGAVLLTADRALAAYGRPVEVID
ncbi:MAG TPA: type II toxin-antitoxin system VapC family toxin [Mycobacteriales bacterium]|nr:type II toxin-antitoxin system VapC family toxin [Mycobacteriales bacterium]